MRKLNLILVLVAAVATPGAAAQAQSSAPPIVPSGNGFKIMYIHSQKLFQDAPGAKEAQTTIQREADKYRAELLLLEDSIKNMMTDYQARQVMLSPDAKKKQEDAIRAKNASFEARSTQFETHMSKRQKELVEPIMERINKTLDALRKEQGLAFILDAAQGSIISADTTLDLTAEVLKRLRGSAAPAVPKKPGS